MEQADVLAKLGRLFVDLGATEEMSERMAGQLWKRSLQIAEERDVKQVVALDQLIRLTISGSQGVGPQGLADDGDSR
jgi:hypothetical protein